jgi:hypothetical protein
LPAIAPIACSAKTENDILRPEESARRGMSLQDAVVPVLLIAVPLAVLALIDNFSGRNST